MSLNLRQLLNMSIVKKNDFSESFSEALRDNKLDSFSAGSAYAASIYPLLKALGWKNTLIFGNI